MTRTPLFAVIASVSLSFTGFLPASAASSQQDMLAENVQKADANGDGALTLDEFTALIDLNAADGIGRAGVIKRMGRESTAFGRIDANADGLISIEELSAMAAQFKQ
ncbi:MAG: hypothetical protein AAF666_17875 [Pseudomonadota bacterium]